MGQIEQRGQGRQRARGYERCWSDFGRFNSHGMDAGGRAGNARGLSQKGGFPEVCLDEIEFDSGDDRQDKARKARTGAQIDASAGAGRN
jgi:hypothetical protein